MTHYPDYHRAARLAYRTLLKLGIDKLPVDILGICKRCKNTKVMTFRDAEKEFDLPDGYFICNGPSESAFTNHRQIGEVTHNIILYNDDRMDNSVQRLRFTLAHELGHILLKHEGNSVMFEMEANCFAQHLLCPAPVVEALDFKDDSKIFMFTSTFGVSRTVAKIVLGNKRPMQDVDPDMRQGIRELFRLDENGTQEILGNTFGRLLRRLG